jgi:hypothetical protein
MTSGYYSQEWNKGETGIVVGLLMKIVKLLCMYGIGPILTLRNINGIR